ncbi:unnamed protein product [Prorocentrum cordatum]|uniref:Glycosyl hydrolase family 13 catalytic domain-containing protein n=1 Tax=Prorocentrum cordatum TaxID=2364126 RepID=A0ABN9PLC0_9DINO|nr:unnamed protein product [Polarella glacialis]
MDGAAAKLGAAPGAAKPFGCTEVDKPKAAKAKAAPTCCVNFALCAPGSRSAWLALAFPEEHPGLAALGAGAGQEIFLQLDGTTNRSGDTWHVEIRPSFPAKGAKYAWLLDPALGPDGFPSAAAKRIVDPCAKELDSSNAQHWNVRGTRRYSPWAVVPDPRAMQKFDWQGVQSPGLAMKDLVIYEAHVRGFTANPDSGLAEGNAGTFLGFVEKIPHLLKLGINCVEFLPVFEFDETACPRKNPSNGEQLCNYWGYSTVAFFVPMQRFSNRDQTSGAIVGFKTLVRELHRQGIEVILDVVFNHTAEGTWGEHNWHSMSAVSKPRYYLLSHGKDTNYTGCGNTMNANDGLCADWICECLRYWVRDMHVDGFRFDLASSLCRGGDGQVQREPHLIKKMLNDPVLSRTKLIAEPWDCSWPDGYLVGKFPSCGTTRWAEWNGVWRDTVRRFIKGDPCMKSEFATRMCGSSDLYRHDGRSPFHSINFITAHDGFTLYDLVSYNEKHNLCNGENSGDDHNNSWNCGHEGNTGDGNIKALRDRQMRNFLAALFLSIGTPMMVFGDEYGRTQHGCNNGWCQDSLSWFSWDGCSGQESRLLRFCRLLIAFRKRHARVFCRDGFLSEKDIWWRTYWDDEYSYLCWVLHDNHDGKYDGILIAFNAGHETRRCDLPPGKEWYRIVDTNLPSPKDICEDEKSATKIGSGDYSMAPRSCIVLKCFADKAGAYDAKLEQDYLDQQRLEDHLETIAQRRMSMEFDMQRTMSRVSFSRLVSDEEAEETWQRTMSQSLMKRQSMMSGFILEMEGPDGEKEFAVQRPDGHQVPVIGPDGLVANGQAAVKKKAEAEAAAKRKAEAEAAAQLKAVEELAAKRKADEELAAKRKADEEAAAKKKEPVVLETPEAVRNLLSGKRALHVKGFGGGLGDVPEEQRSEQRRQDEAAAQAIERFCPDFLVVDGIPGAAGSSGTSRPMRTGRSAPGWPCRHSFG